MYPVLSYLPAQLLFPSGPLGYIWFHLTVLVYTPVSNNVFGSISVLTLLLILGSLVIGIIASAGLFTLVVSCIYSTVPLRSQPVQFSIKKIKAVSKRQRKRNAQRLRAIEKALSHLVADAVQDLVQLQQKEAQREQTDEIYTQLVEHADTHASLMTRLEVTEEAYKYSESCSEDSIDSTPSSQPRRRSALSSYLSTPQSISPISYVPQPLSSEDLEPREVLLQDIEEAKERGRILRAREIELKAELAQAERDQEELLDLARQLRDRARFHTEQEVFGGEGTLELDTPDIDYSSLLPLHRGCSSAG